MQLWQKITRTALLLFCSCCITGTVAAKESYKREQTLRPTEAGAFASGATIGLPSGYGIAIAKNKDFLFVASPTAGFGPTPVMGNTPTALGAIYVYKKDGGKWKRTQLITNAFLNFLGAQQVYSEGNWLFVSRPVTAGFKGSLQLYRLNEKTSIWELFQELNDTIQGLYKLTPGDRTTTSFGNRAIEHGAFFGFNFDADVENGHLLVGAQYQKNKKRINSGAVFSFILDKKTNRWKFDQKIITPHSHPIANDTFGANIAVEKNLALISTGSINPSPKSGDGIVYVFERTDGEWKFVQRIQGKKSAAPSLAGNGFGASLALSNDWALIGSPLERRSASRLYSGAVYFFKVSHGTGKEKLHLVKKVRSDNRRSVFTGLGHLALNEDTALISDAGRSGRKGARQGGVLVFKLKDNKWHKDQVLFDRKGSAFSFFGQSVELSREHAFAGTDQFLIKLLYESLGILPLFPPGVVRPEKVVVFKKE